MLKKITGVNKLIKQFREIKDLEIANQQRLDEICWANVFNSAITDSKWLHNKSFNPGRWAAGYPMLYILYRIYNDIKPNNILEFGLGESTKLAYQYKAANTAAKLTIIEQDANWLKFFANEIYDVSPDTVLLPLETVKVNEYDVNSYSNLIPSLPDYKYNLVVIDGPWGSEHFSRYQIIDIAENKLLAPDFIIILDDYNRAGEQETAAKLRELLSKKGVKFVEGVYSGAKQTLVICAEQYKFLTSL